MAIQVASSSSSSLRFTSKTKYRYDIFLSFRGEDTRHTFTGSLYNSLWRKGINAFIDDKKLGKGERIAPSLLKAIEKSRIAIVVFSTNYATSTWCLDELTHIMKCKKEKNQLVVIPIFYKVDPMDVLYVRNNFEKAMADHEERFRNDADQKDRNRFDEAANDEDRLRKNMEKLQKWRSALYEAASLSSAWLFNDGCQSEFIERIVERSYSMLPPKSFHNVDYIVGLEPCIEEVMKSLFDESNNSICFFGIYGTGGIGKTTLAKALYSSIFYNFDGACFLLDVKEESKKHKGILRLQRTLLSEILEEKKMKLISESQGKTIIKHRLSNKKILLVLDDVDEAEQLEKLAGGYDWFGYGSKIIITTRNKQLLIACNVEKTYEMKQLDHFSSLELFSWHAFSMRQPPNDYKNMSNHVVRYAHGLPLALKLVGSNLANKGIEEWRSTLEKYKNNPEITIHEVLKVSYDCLQEGAKRVFLDIACFFRKKTLEFIEDVLEACDDGGRFYMEILIDKSLITIEENGRCLYMHDLIQQMGKEIVRQEAPSNPYQRSRIWYYKDVLEVLQDNLGSDKIEGIMFDPPHQKVVEWSGMAFEKMNNLKILIIRNAQFSTSPKYFPNSLRLLDWKGYPSNSLPKEFNPSKLICLKLYRSHFILEKPFKRFQHVTYLNFSKCKFITDLPDMSEFLNLKRLIFRKCHKLTKVHNSVGFLSKLEILNASECPLLTTFPHEINMPSLQELHLNFCKNLNYLPNIGAKMEELYEVSAAMTGIEELPSSIGNLPKLYHLDLSYCKSLKELPNSLLTLPKLGNLELADIHPLGRESFKKLMMQPSNNNFYCENIEILDLNSFGLMDEDLHLTLKCFKNVKDLCLSKNDFVSIPECIKECPYLEMLQVNDCKMLRNIPELPLALVNIAAKNCSSLTTQSSNRLWSQAKKIFPRKIVMPTTTIPDWFNYCCKSGKLSLRIRGKFPRILLAYEMGEVNTNLLDQKEGKNTWLLPLVEVCMSINGQNKLPWIRNNREARRKGRVWTTKGDQGHVICHDLLSDFDEKELKGLNKFLGQDWNDVVIRITCFPTDIMSIVNCGIYVDKQKTDMENVLFMSGSLKRRKVVASHHNKPPKKRLENVAK